MSRPETTLLRSPILVKKDEAGRKKLAQVLTQVYMKYGRGPDDFETIPY